MCTSCMLGAMTVRKLSEAHISVKSQTTVKCLVKLTSSVTETIIFMYLGIAAVSTARHWNTAFVVLTLVFCLLYRTIGQCQQTSSLYLHFLRVCIMRVLKSQLKMRAGENILASCSRIYVPSCFQSINVTVRRTEKLR